MIPLIASVCQGQQPAHHWQQLLAQAIRQPRELLDAVGVSVAQLNGPYAAGVIEHRAFPLRVPRGYVARMRQGDPSDPLLLQVLPRQAEMEDSPGFVADPVGDNPAIVQAGLLHKYQGRVLLVTTAACPIHCRYCFRRHFDYQDNQLDEQAWANTLEYIRQDRTIHEVILSGGDPLSLSNERLAAISERLAPIPHLRRLRIHSRMPIVLPERIDEGLLTWLTNLPWQTIMVTHTNHANEIDTQVSEALGKMKSAGLTLLNQAVLLKSVNDTSHALVRLSETLFEAGVLPYYLHLLDRVKGAHHFDVPEAQAQALYREIQQQLPGYLVPRLVREIAGRAHKVSLAFEPGAELT